MKFQAVTFDEAAKSRIDEAASFERRSRIESFLEVGFSYKNFKLTPIRVAHVLEMDYVDNRILSEGDADVDDYVHLLWMLKHPSDSRGEKSFAKWAKKNLDEDAKVELLQFVANQFNDLPSSGSSSTSFKVVDSSTPLIYMVDLLCSEYGWSIDYVKNLPLSVALQMMQQILKRLDPKYSIRNKITQTAQAKELNRLK